MDEFWTIAIVAVALIGSIALAAVLLGRARSNAKPEAAEEEVPVPPTATRRQRRILEKLEPLPELPTLMDLVRQEIADLGIENIAGSEGLSGPVKLKVYRRDHLEEGGCDHDSVEYVINAGVTPSEATEEDVTLICSQCAESGTNNDE